MTDHRQILIGVVLVNLAVAVVAAMAADPYESVREDLLREIELDVMETSRFLGKGTLNPRVMDAMRIVPRHAFVPDKLQPYAYENRPLPIGHGQTISQPYIVAIMTDLMALTPDSRVLEVGTGSGYQAAVLAKLVGQVYTMEIIQPLGEQADNRLEQLGYDNVEVRIDDGYYGWPDKAPFDAIIVTAASGHIPPPLIRQLAVGGRMMIPVGSRFMTQQLILVEKMAGDRHRTRQILPVRFVPLTGEH